MKGKTEFTYDEIEQLKVLIKKLRNAERDTQKCIRGKMRKIGFYISDFGSSGMTVDMLYTLIKSGEIKVKGKKCNATTMPETIVKVKESFVSTANHSLKQGLEPWVGKEPKVLILGTLPGDESIKQQSYYANKNNSFWEILRTVFPGFEDLSNKDFVAEVGIALWDCLSAASRKGSTDAGFDEKSQVANDIATFLSQHHSIKMIVLNGKGNQPKGTKRTFEKILS